VSKTILSLLIVFPGSFRMRLGCEGFEFGSDLIFIVKALFCLDLQCRENEVGVKAVGG